MPDTSYILAAGGGGTMKQQVFNSSGTWTRPDGVDAVMVFAVGAGGGAGGVGTTVTNIGAASGGGGSGEYIDWTPIDVTANVVVTIGAGGAGGTGANNGASGGDTSFGSLLTAYGGAGGGQAPSAGTFVPSTSTSLKYNGGGSGYRVGTQAFSGGGAGVGSATGVYAAPYADMVDYSQTAGGQYFKGRAGFTYNKFGARSGGHGIGRYCWGGSGGRGYTSGVTYDMKLGTGGAGRGNPTSGGPATVNGGHADANTGSGGGAAIAIHATSGATGGNGAAGQLIVMWFE